MVVSQVDDNPGTLGGILWFYDSWWHYIGIICAWPLIKYIYIYWCSWCLMVIGSLCVCMFVFGSVIMKLVVWTTTCLLFWPAPPSRLVCVFGSATMILVVWITACFLFWTAPTPPGFNLSMTTVCMCFVWFNNHDTCCLNYSMFFVLNCPHPSRFQFKHDYCVYVFCLVL